MSIKNKIKNVKMFGFRSVMPKRSHQLVIGLVLVAVFFSLGQIFAHDESPSITGRVVEDFGQEVVDEPTFNSEEIEETSQEELEKGEEYEVYEYYEYGGECSYDIKQAEDDINDVLSFLGDNEKTYNDVKDEYESKLESLKNEYEPRIERAREEYEIDQETLIEAQDRLQELQEICSY